MASIFEQTILPKLDFSNFPLRETQLVTCNFGQLIPCYVREVLPNDVFTMKAIANVQFAPMVAPMMQDVTASIHFFYVPNRIVWDDFETFITGAEEGHELKEEEIPPQAGFEVNTLRSMIVGDKSLQIQGSLLDYFGLPNELENARSGDDSNIEDYVLRDYFKIWFDYYRDENLQYSFNDLTTDPAEEVDFYKFWKEWRADGQYIDNHDNRFWYGFNKFNPFYRSYRKDYFTACLPTPQKGEPVKISLASTAPVSIDTKAVFLNKQVNAAGSQHGPAFEMSGVPVDFPAPTNFEATGSPDQGKLGMMTWDESYGPGSRRQLEWIEASLSKTATQFTPLDAVADLSAASAVTVEQLREAFAVQEILESLSMRGSRFTEFLKGNFGVTPDDYRLQRPQFLGGIVTPVQVQQVIQQAGINDDAGQLTGYAAGRAFAAAGDRVFRMRFKEHGYIIAILSVMPKAYYYQGIPRHFRRRDRFDYYMPQTAHLGEQAVLNEELYFSSNPTKNEAVFGYIPRWAEYKTSTSGIHGDFRGSLNYYHMARIFDTLPTLSKEFITTENVQPRPFSVWQEQRPNINHLIWAELLFDVTGSRPMPYQSIPKVL